MRKELYNLLCRELGAIVEIKHIDLWNRNVEFIEQEEGWERPAVFVEFGPIQWKPIVNGVEYRAEPQITLHIVTDWTGAASEGSPFKEDALEVFDLPDKSTGGLPIWKVRPSESLTLRRASPTMTTRTSWRP